jgi:hypothetical protein
MWIAAMSGFFATLGVCLGIYTAYAAFSGTVYARSGPWGRSIHRAEEPWHYWSTIVVYGLLTSALLFYF